MKVYISVDAEGLPGIFHVFQVDPKYFMYGELRKVVTKVVKEVATELKALGVDEVWVADAHWFMGNIAYEELPDYVTLIRGYERPVSMVYGIDRGFDAALFLGYHASAGTPRSVLDHTFSGRTFFEVRINGVRASEFYLNALVAGHYGVPVILVLGDDKLRGEVAKVAPWVTYVECKESVSRTSAIMRPLGRVIKELREGVRVAIKKLKEGGVKPLKIDGVITAEFTFRRTDYADAAELLPGAVRVDANTVKYTSNSIIEVYRVMEVFSLITAGVEHLREALTGKT